MKRVQVLLSTYNGERYIVEQIESIMKQSYREVAVLIRDDGSTDGTIEKIQQLEKTYLGRIELIQGANLGVVGSFFELLIMSDPHADYYCFCDQDDVWFDHKVKSAVSKLDTTVHSGEPAMVFTSTQLTDGELNSKGIWPKSPRREPSFYNALYENVAIGATITMNKSARDLFVDGRSVDSNKILMHDWWFYLLLSAFGKVIYDPEPSMMYRQHGNNVVGGSNSLVGKLKNKLNSFKKHTGKELLLIQATEFRRIYDEQLKHEKREQLDLFLASRPRMIDRFKYISRSKLHRQSRSESLLFKFLIIIGFI
ncbi:glycosyltransferase family 2 protein [Paenibacillus sp. GCM10028914]|uniref:glycosyltransferase family 2 protein n=1 Tax=Paenibacillus sp. GCM10028914 TaxID=3273416 RepID=UPI00361DBD18